MTHVNVKRLVDTITRTNAYQPLVEAIVNAIDSIELAKRQDGKIVVKLVRDSQQSIALGGDVLPAIVGFKVEDNGVGFNDANLESFNTVYSEFKVKQGGKGFGRFVFLKYFQNIKVKSIYKEGGQYLQRTFSFVLNDDIIRDAKVEPANLGDTETQVSLSMFKRDYQDRFEKRLETIARKLLEKLLVFFVRDDYACPTIVISEEDGSHSIILNDYLKDPRSGIQEVGNKGFTLLTTDKKQKEDFQVKIFKVLYGESRSSINLVADHRLVTEEALYKYIPEFKDDFYENITNDKGDEVSKNYTIKVYTLGNYLDRSVSLDRDGFEFEIDRDLLYPFSRSEIERQAAIETASVFSKEVKTRQAKKEERIRSYVNSEAPWYKAYLESLDYPSIAFDANDEDIDSEFQRVKFNKEQVAKREIKSLLDNKTIQPNEKLGELISKITEVGRVDLVHYVCNRKLILDFLRKLLERDNEGNASLEEEVHNIIFPMGKDSTNCEYEGHNLWLLDERLVFSEYVASDKKISKKLAPKEPDLVIFDQKQVFRGGDNEYSNALTIFEFKRPKREGYTQEENPLLQIAQYLEEIRAGKYETPRGVETIKVNENTPVYGYVVCDITKKVQDFANQWALTLSPDGEGYFGFHPHYRFYVEIMSFKKLVKDANLRNKIFFKKLQLE